MALVPRQPILRLAQEGARGTITLEAAADRPVPAWSVAAIDLTGSQDGQRYVDVELDRDTVAPGDTATLTVTLRRRHRVGWSIVGVVSTLGGESSLWPLAVSTR